MPRNWWVIGLGCALVGAHGPQALGRPLLKPETICHVSASGGGGTTITVGGAALEAHLAHGDSPSACAPPPTVAGDRDADGVLDWLDNCLDSANADQRDTDRDGFGNACDADFDNDGLVEGDDVSGLARQLGRQPQRGSDAGRGGDYDLNGDGRVDPEDLRIATGLLGRAPGPLLDSDGDGTADLRDPCLDTPRGTPAVLPGCAALDLLERPGALTDEVTAAATEVAEAVAPRPAFERTLRELGAARALVREGEATARAGDPCGTRALLAEAADGLASARAEAGRIAAAADAAASSRGDDGDVTEDEAMAIGREYLVGRIADAHDGAARAADAFGRLCATAASLRARGIVARTLDGRRRIKFTDGRLVGLAVPLQVDGTPSEGAAAEVSGLDFGDGTGLATDIACDEASTGIEPSPCLALRFTPVQRLPPFFSGPFVLHDPRGYSFFDGFLLEAGMGVAVQRLCPLPPGDEIPVEFTRYSVDVTLDYTDVNGLGHVEEPVALDLVPQEDPVRLPAGIDPNVVATFHVRHFRQICHQDLSCGPKTKTAEEDLLLLVRERGSLCEVSYEKALFDVNDQIPSHARFNQATAAFPWPLGHFEAEGYGLCGPGPTSCAPAVSTISGSQGFAIHNFDFYPIHPQIGIAGAIQRIVASAVTGVPHAAGLRWPRVRALNFLGFEFQYSCTLPKLVRDVVNFCDRQETHDHRCIAWGADDKCTQKSSHTITVNAFYRLPFLEGDTSWHQGQANLPPSGTHKGGYAYDMVTPCDNDIRAARAGRVIDMVESRSRQKWYSDGGTPDDQSDDVNHCQEQCIDAGEPSPNCCPGHGNSCWNPGDSSGANYVLVRHQDGTIGQYVHMKKDSVEPVKGDLVRRGDLVGLVGVTGNTTGPHLHLAERFLPSDCCTHLALFEALDPADGSQRLECYEPMSGDELRSNSQPPP